MIEVDPTNPDPALFRGCRSYRNQGAVTAVRLQEPIALVSLLGREQGEVGDYLCRDPKTGCAWLVAKRLFESTYFTEREPARPRKGYVIV